MMSLKLPADYHMHTSHSGDSDAPMEEMILRSIELGLDEICLTDHMDIDFPPIEGIPPKMFELDVPPYLSEWRSLSEKYSDRITVRFGVELGLQLCCAEKNRVFAKEYPFDFVIGSVHLDDGKDPYRHDYFEGITEEEGLMLHLTNTLDNLRAFDEFDALGHIDYVTRCFPSGDPYYDPEPYYEVTDAIFDHLIKKEIALEINSYPLRTRDDLIHPLPSLLKRYHDMGGRLITFGADAHRTENVAAGFARAAEIARETGFTEYCSFKNRERIMRKL